MKATKMFDLAAMVGGEVVGNPELIINGLNEIDSAQEGQITFLISKQNLLKLSQSTASAVIVPKDLEFEGKTLLRVHDPNLAAAVIHSYFCDIPFQPKGIHSKSHIGDGCDIPEDVTISPMVVIGNRVKIGTRVAIGPGTVIGDNVVIGDDTILHSNVTVEHGCRIGNRVIIYSGAVIGSDGFGYATDSKGHHIKRPQVGIVVIEDDVEVGANTCIDRATFGKTLIKRGTKIDNLVMIGHNAQIGEDSILVGQVGIGGSATLGNHVVMGGQSAVKDHVNVGNRVMAAGRAGIHEDLEGGKIVSGMPAIPHRQWLRATAIFNQLPELAKELRELKKNIAALKIK